MFAVRITAKVLGQTFVQYAGLRGMRKTSIDKVEGWKNAVSAERFIEGHKRMFKDTIADITYEIIVL